MKQRIYIKVMLLFLLLTFSSNAKAQDDIRITKFEEDPMGMTARVNPVYDRSGNACAVIKFMVSDMNTEIETNLGVLQTDTSHTGEIRVWVPLGIRRITIRHRDMKPLLYNVPIKIESKIDYVADIDLPQRSSGMLVGPTVFLTPPKKATHAYLTAGYNIMSIAGPSMALGVDFNHHQIELGGVYGLNKTDDLFFYGADGQTLAAYHYHAIRAQFRYGYEIRLMDEILSITPLVGCAGNLFLGQETMVVGDKGYKKANSLSAIGAVRIAASLGKSFRLYVAPEYDFSIKKNNVCGLVSWYDSTMKNWCSGINLNAGIMIRF